MIIKLGLRGPMQAGFACMNDLTVIQASQVRTLTPHHSSHSLLLTYPNPSPLTQNIY